MTALALMAAAGWEDVFDVLELVLVVLVEVVVLGAGLVPAVPVVPAVPEELGVVLVTLADDPIVELLWESPQPESAAIMAASAIGPRTDFCISIFLE